jgi:hypothetical protein
MDKVTNWPELAGFPNARLPNVVEPIHHFGIYFSSGLPNVVGASSKFGIYFSSKNTFGKPAA